MADSSPFSQLVPGFDFLQSLAKNAGDAMPAMSQWIAPTLDPDEIDKRIRDLRTVQFWLEQNSKMIAATVQALEVQRMTLTTLRTMNLPLSDVGESMKLRTPEHAAAEPPAAPKPGRRKTAASNETARAAGVVDPMQWWAALTQQFTELAAQAVKEPPTVPVAAPAVAPAAAPKTKGNAPKRRKR